MANQIGKIYQCRNCGAEFLVTKGGDGVVQCCGQPAQIKKDTKG